ncbi:hypothetical protein FQN50_002698 [Emmonsiellopsis sp. PD_5]|nr:hypothetical protein FQN50_002698 [Emmonsiellopsis sp. PD_5]
MGVTGLWTVVKPCARPIKIETLNRKRLAVDASIWIYQFLKAVRDKEGNALRNSHIVGFFRRICKLLYFGIKPVFVFDGGAPILKRQTITSRKQRREGRREDAARTAGKLLAVQIQRQAEEEAQRRKQTGPTHIEPEEELPENLVYVDELHMTPKERQKNRQFRKQDQYHLPELDVSLAEMGAPNDPRIMSQEELEEYARQFHSGEDINLYDFSKIDFNSPFFLSLPSSDRYNILNAARLRSRLRMGLSKEQLDNMFPDRMAFSRFQIERVKERNDLTQRLMHINGMTDDDSLYGTGASTRIAGERGKEYVLVKNNGVEGGWALGVLGTKDEGQRNKPIDVEEYGKQALSDDQNEWDEEDEEFEDVPIEGLNRLPKLPMFEKGVFDRSLNRHAQEIADKRKAVYESRQQQALAHTKIQDEAEVDDALFLPHEEDLDVLFEEQALPEPSDDEDLHRAIQMSLEAPDDDMFDIDKPSWSTTEAPSSHVPAKETEGRDHSSDMSDDEDMNFLSALSKSKITKAPASNARPALNPFDGPLPFESLKISKAADRQMATPVSEIEDEAGGFEKGTSKGKEKAQPLPPWFGTKMGGKLFINQEDDNNFDGTDPYARAARQENILNRHSRMEVINVDDEPSQEKEVIDVDTFGAVDQKPVLEPPVEAIPTSAINAIDHEVNPATDTENRTTEHPKVENEQQVNKLNFVGGDVEETYEWEATDEEDNIGRQRQTKDSTGVGAAKESITRSPTPDFEDVEIAKPAAAPYQPREIDSASKLPEEPDNIDFQNDVADFSDPEDDELMNQLATEAEEHARFASTLNAKSQAENVFDYEHELKQLRAQQKKDRRDADEVSQIMVQECQELLGLFGLPYITAPMEAEAQCAELVSLGLVDGVVTDDSDIFLFGGTRVYKNMFNQAKFVECYLSSDLEKEYDLDRRKLIRFAHLLGSDYTEGIPGVGPVTALEILTEFSTLENFRDWWSQVQMGAKIPEDSHSAFRKKFKKNATKLFLPPGFPDNHVDTAYLEPEVDTDPSAFQWGVPDLNALRQFLMSTIGWSQERTDEVLVPVIRDMNRREQEGTQSNITNFFQGGQGAGAFAPHRRSDGKSRMEKAFTRLRHQAETKRKGGEHTEENEGESRAANDAAPSKRASRKRTTNNGSKTPDADHDESDEDYGNKPGRKSAKKQRTATKA